jgi:hypothetical protein
MNKIHPLDLETCLQILAHIFFPLQQKLLLQQITRRTIVGSAISSQPHIFKNGKCIRIANIPMNAETDSTKKSAKLFHFQIPDICR